MPSAPPNAATYCVPFQQDGATGSTAVVSEQLDASQSWFTIITGSNATDIVAIQAPCAGLLSFLDATTIVIDATPFAALRSMYSQLATDPMIAKVTISGLNLSSTATCNGKPCFFDPASYLNATAAGTAAATASQNLLAMLQADPTAQISILPGEILGIVDTSQPGATLYAFLQDGSNVPLTWAFAELLNEGSQILPTDPNMANWPVNPADTIYVDFHVQSADDPTSILSPTLGETMATLAVNYADASGNTVTVPPTGMQANAQSQRVVVCLPTQAITPTALPNVVVDAGASLTGTGLPIWVGAATGDPSPSSGPFTVTLLGTTGMAQKLSQTASVTTGCPNSQTQLNVTAPASNPTILQVGTATFGGNASSTAGMQVTIDGQPVPAGAGGGAAGVGQFQDQGAGQWTVLLPVTAGQHVYTFTSSDGSTATVTVTGVDISVQTTVSGTVVNNPGQTTQNDTLFVFLTQNTDPLASDSLILNASILNIDAFGASVDVEWQLKVDSSIPIRAKLRPSAPQAWNYAYWIDFSTLATETVTGVNSPSQTWSPPNLTLDVESVQADNAALATANQSNDVAVIGLTTPWTGGQPQFAGPIVGTAVLGANVSSGGTLLTTLTYLQKDPTLTYPPEFFIVGNDIRNLSVQDFVTYISDCFTNVFGVDGALGVAPDQLALLMLAIFMDESKVQQFAGYDAATTATLPTPGPKQAQQAPGQLGVVVGRPAGLGIGQIDLDVGETAPPLISTAFDWHANVLQAVTKLKQKFDSYSTVHLVSLAKSAETKRLTGLYNPTPPSNGLLEPFSDALQANNSYLLRCYVKLYNGWGKAPTDPIWKAVCPYESSLAWNPAQGGSWASPAGAPDIVEDPPHTATQAQPVPSGYPTINGIAYDEPYTANIFPRYLRYVALTTAGLTWTLVKQ